MSARARTTRSAELIGRTARLAARQMHKLGGSGNRAGAGMALLARALREAEGVSARRARQARARGRRAKVRAWQGRNRTAR